jgi:hypothetical protein
MDKWDTNKVYTVGDVVTYNNKGYESLADIPMYGNPPENNTDWKEYIMAVSESILKPYVSSITRTFFKRGTSYSNVKITGNNFDDSVKVFIDNCEVQVTNVTPTEITIDVNTFDINTTSLLEVQKSGITHYGETVNIRISDGLQGNGKPGEFLTTFAKATGIVLWGKEWKVETFGKCIPDSYFKSSNKSTPSGNTGPARSFQDGEYYMHIEASNPNNGVGNYGQVSTDNFANIQNIEMYFHMHGTGINALRIEGYDGNTWNEVYKIVGQTHLDDTSPWKYINIDVSTHDVEIIRFVFDYAYSYQGDIALGAIKITSI